MRSYALNGYCLWQLLLLRTENLALSCLQWFYNIWVLGVYDSALKSNEKQSRFQRNNFNFNNFNFKSFIHMFISDSFIASLNSFCGSHQWTSVSWYLFDYSSHASYRPLTNDSLHVACTVQYNYHLFVDLWFPRFDALEQSIQNWFWCSHFIGIELHIGWAFFI